MREWFGFVLSNKRILNFGFLFNFFSSFGQTFFISLYVPFFIDSFHISNATFGSMYAIVTVISAFLISAVGKYIDRMSLKKYGLLVFLGLVASVILLSQARNIIVLIAGLFLIRWFGQGLMVHTSITGIAKYFDVHRGKALGFTALGQPAGQFLLPFLVMPLISLTSWRISLVVMAAFSLVVIIPSLWAITPVTGFSSNTVSEKIKSENKTNYLSEIKFWIIISNSFLIPFIGTAVFLYQFMLGQNYGWDASWVVFSFAFYAVFNAISLLLSGNLVDRFSGVKLFPLYLIPVIMAMILFMFSEDKWVFPLFYTLLGISSGLGSTIKTAVQVEIYGTGNLGKIRSYFSTILVLSTALGPPSLGFFIDRGYSIETIFAVMAVIVFIIFILSFRIKQYR